MFTFADASPLAPSGGLADNVRSHHFVSGDRRLEGGNGEWNELETRIALTKDVKRSAVESGPERLVIRK